MTYEFRVFEPTDDAGYPTSKGIAFAVEGGIPGGDLPQGEATRFSGHGSGRGPVYHSTTKNAYTANTLVDNVTGHVYYTSGIHSWTHTYWGYRTETYFAQFVNNCWHIVMVQVDPWDSCVRYGLLGRYNGRMRDGFCPIIKVSRSRASELKDMGIECMPLIAAMYEKGLNPYLPLASDVKHSFTLLTTWGSPKCPYFNDYVLVSEFGYYGCSTNLRLGLSMATEDMVQNLPRSDVNLIASAIDVVKVLLGDVQAISSLADIWLTYRYSYTTNKLDIQSMKTYLSRLSNLSMSGGFTAYGSYRDTHGTFRCQASFTPYNSDVFQIQELAREAHRQLSLVNTWDLIPWSFVIDWILPIEDICRSIDTSKEMLELRPTSIWYSYKGLTDLGSGLFESTYFRLPETTQFVTTPLTLFNQSNGETSDRTKTFRCLDSVALIIGR